MPKDYLISAPHNQHKRGLKRMDTVNKMNLETPVPPGQYLESVVVDHATSSESVNNCHSEYVERAAIVCTTLLSESFWKLRTQFQPLP